MSVVYDIRTVAIYLRKSRDNKEEEDVLEKHRRELVDLCKEKGWAYTIYEEIGSGEKIETRPKMMELLRDVELNMYDAVVAVHFDRLSRGDEEDQAKIKKILAKTETLFITPTRLYDYNNDNDVLLADVEGMIARLEYKTIVRRFKQGKARGAKAGFWTNGSPPFPYKYNPKTRKAEPDPEKLPIYRFMVEKALQGFSPTDIAFELNNTLKVPSPKGGYWQPAVVRRLLCDEVHLGKIIIGKKKKLAGSDEVVYRPRSEWVIFENCHEPVKTQEEHDKILFLIKKNEQTPRRSRAGTYAFSGLIKCGLCGYTMQIYKRVNGERYLKSCQHKDPFGNKCKNLGSNLQKIEVAVKEAILYKEKQLEEAIEKGIKVKDINLITELLKQKMTEINKQEKAIERIFTAFEEGIYTKEEFMKRKEVAVAKLDELNEEYKQLQRMKEEMENTTNEDMLRAVRKILMMINSKEYVDPKELNRMYRGLIHSIVWTRTDIQDEGSIQVNFL